MISKILLLPLSYFTVTTKCQIIDYCQGFPQTRVETARPDFRFLRIIEQGSQQEGYLEKCQNNLRKSLFITNLGVLVGRISDCLVDAGGEPARALDQNPLFMGKRLKAAVSLVAAKTARPNPAKRHVCCILQGTVIDYSRSRRRFSQDPINLPLVMAEDVQGQGFIPVIDVRDDLSNLLVRDDWQQRPKDLAV